MFCTCFVNKFDMSWFFNVIVIWLHHKYNIFKPAFLTEKTSESVVLSDIYNFLIEFPKDGLLLKQTKDFINACLKTGNSRFLEVKNEEDLYVSKQKSGTWMHRIFAWKFAAWLDPYSEDWVYTTIDKIIFGNYREIKEATVEKLKAEKLQQLKKQELMETYPDLSEFFALEKLITTAQRNGMKAVKHSIKKLRTDLFD